MPPPNRPASFFSWFAWSLATWLALAGAVAGLMNNPDTELQIPIWRWLLALTMPSIAALCGWQALRAGNERGHTARVIFWMPATGGALLTGLLLQGRLEVSSDAGDHALLVIVALLPVLPLIYAVVRGLRSGGLKAAGLGWLFDIPVGFACLSAVVFVIYGTWMRGLVDPLRARAAQSWADSGHPMPDFQKSLQPVQENESLRELTADLKPFGVVNLYKTTDNTNTIQTPPALEEMYVETAGMPGDTIANVPKASAWLEAHEEDFNRLYQGVLQRDPPVWSCNPEEGFLVRLPNFPALRKVSELICSDAYHRLQKKDGKGAADAIAAGLRMAQNLGEQPLMVSDMTYVGIESLYAPVIARMPAEPDDMQRLAEDVKMSRRQFATTVQWEAWVGMTYMETDWHNTEDLHWDTHKLWPVQPLPAQLGRLTIPLYCRSLGRFYCSKDWLYQADVVRISARASELAGGDLGAAEMDKSLAAHLTPFSPDWSRAWLRVNFMLLIREQAAMIRYARAQMEAGKAGSFGERDSVVIPGAKWELAGDKEENTLTVKLEPVPKWAQDNSVMGAEFFMNRLDGRRPWQLLPVPPKPEQPQ